ncbi:MAG TPA: MBL fold metallo-hydrolase [Henriciella marina]|uniref:MBL fold metallo-hydrolase n=1 Tax=Henriciella sp. TaxID=1968823 RepID=UPI0017B7FB1C|nr:MBL fold metallo-hydrolase [Henriciella sp.]HIG21695.1 MBL fold metallo-hydrolase [Henriciella sp.]HIK64316.1 MBL fold metallo-hydrolase [Henriciella marina]
MTFKTFTQRTAMVAALALAGAAPALAHGSHTHTAQTASPTPVETTDLGDGIYMLTGRGGNIGVLSGEDGTFVIDSQYADMAPALLSAIEDISGEAEVRFLLNTHWHGDHTGGNVPMADTGATILAHDGVRTRLTTENSSQMGGETRVTPPAPEAAWPLVTYSEEIRVHLNGQTIHIIHLPDAHTDGDSAVYFEEANVLHTGDVMFSGRFPFVDVWSGGTFAGYIKALSTLYDLTNDETRIIPGHGPESTREDIKKLRDMMVAAVAAVEEEMSGGASLEAVQAANPLAPWAGEWDWGFINAERFTALIYTDLSS